MMIFPEATDFKSLQWSCRGISCIAGADAPSAPEKEAALKKDSSLSVAFFQADRHRGYGFPPDNLEILLCIMAGGLLRYRTAADRTMAMKSVKRKSVSCQDVFPPTVNFA